MIRVLVVLCDKPEWESAVRVCPLGGRVGRVTRFAGSPYGGTGEPSDTTNPTLTGSEQNSAFGSQKMHLRQSQMWLRTSEI